MRTVRVRQAQLSDVGRIAVVYNEGIAGREATFETEPRQASDFLTRVASERYPLLVAEFERSVVGWAGLAPYSQRPVYAGVGECSIYVAESARGQGVGRELCDRLLIEAHSAAAGVRIGLVQSCDPQRDRAGHRVGAVLVGARRVARRAPPPRAHSPRLARENTLRTSTSPHPSDASSKPRKLDGLDAPGLIHAGRIWMRALWTEWSVEVRVLSGASKLPAKGRLLRL
jgi:L-amino acid N-acyltransferase YncA